MQAYELRAAGAVIHSHSLNALLATLIDPTATEFTVTNLEMIKVRLAEACGAACLTWACILKHSISCKFNKLPF